MAIRLDLVSITGPDTNPIRTAAGARRQQLVTKVKVRCPEV